MTEDCGCPSEQTGGPGLNFFWTLLALLASDDFCPLQVTCGIDRNVLGDCYRHRGHISYDSVADISFLVEPLSLFPSPSES